MGRFIFGHTKIYFLSLIAVLFTALFLGGCGEAAAPQWSPPVEGLRWGMSLEEAVQVLNCKDDSETSSAGDGLQTLTLSTARQLTYGVQAEKITLTFITDTDLIDHYSGLIEVAGLCGEKDIAGLKEKINGSYAGSRKTDDFDKVSRWESDILANAADAQKLEERLSDQIGDLESYEALKAGMLGKPLVRIELHESDGQAGWLAVNAKTQVLAEALRKK